MTPNAIGAALALTLATVIATLGLGIGSSPAADDGPGAEPVARTAALQAGVADARRDASPGTRTVPERASRDGVRAAAPASSARPPFLGEFEVTCYALRGTTSTGRQVGQDVVAVDPRVIPYGTRIYIEDVGQRVAADTGRLIKGHRLDIWASTAEVCRQFGRQHLDVHLIR